MNIGTRVIEETNRLKGFGEGWKLGRFRTFQAEAPPTGVQAFNIAAKLTTPSLLAASTLVWIAKDMVDLVRHASRTLPVYAWSPKVLPWEAAVCIGEKPLLTLAHKKLPKGQDHSVLQWGSGELSVGNRCVVVLWAFDPPFHAVPVPALVEVLREGQMINAEAVFTIDDENNVGDRDWSEVQRFICTLWLLLQQKVAVKRTIHPERAARRRWVQAESRPIPDITIIELRRPLNSDSGNDASHDVNWSHRWLVDGHWREQWHPSIEQHVPTWIAPYVKGPEEKPLVVKQRVHAWVR